MNRTIKNFIRIVSIFLFVATFAFVASPQLPDWMGVSMLFIGIGGFYIGSQGAELIED